MSMFDFLKPKRTPLEQLRDKMLEAADGEDITFGEKDVQIKIRPNRRYEPSRLVFYQNYSHNPRFIWDLNSDMLCIIVENLDHILERIAKIAESKKAKKRKEAEKWNKCMNKLEERL